jgi:hypothetical protein
VDSILMKIPHSRWNAIKAAISFYYLV